MLLAGVEHHFKPRHHRPVITLLHLEHTCVVQRPEERGRKKSLLRASSRGRQPPGWCACYNNLCLSGCCCDLHRQMRLYSGTAHSQPQLEEFLVQTLTAKERSGQLDYSTEPTPSVTAAMQSARCMDAVAAGICWHPFPSHLPVHTLHLLTSVRSRRAGCCT